MVCFEDHQKSIPVEFVGGGQGAFEMSVKMY